MYSSYSRLLSITILMYIHHIVITCNYFLWGPPALDGRVQEPRARADAQEPDEPGQLVRRLRRPGLCGEPGERARARAGEGVALAAGLPARRG